MESQYTLEEVRNMSDGPTIFLLFITLIFVAIMSLIEEKNR